MAERIPSPYGVDYNYSFPRAKIGTIFVTAKKTGEKNTEMGLFLFNGSISPIALSSSL